MPMLLCFQNFQRPLPSKVLATGLSNLAAKRRSVDELRSATVQEPQSSRSSSTGATNLSDIDMETVVLGECSRGKFFVFLEHF